jgi:hypothetical protein
MPICERRLAMVTRAHVLAVDPHGAAGHVEEAGQQADHRALAGAGLAHQGDALSRLGVDRHIRRAPARCPCNGRLTLSKSRAR